MSDLNTLQNSFLQYLQTGTAPHSGNFNPKQLNVYRQSVIGFHQNALRLAYPVINRIVGQDYFDQLAWHHYQRVGMNVASLNQYGHDFAESLHSLLSTRQELAEFNYLPNLAQLEWLMQQSYYARDSQAFNYAKLSNKAPDEVYLHLQPSIKLISSIWPLRELIEEERVVVERVQEEQAKGQLLETDAEASYEISAVTEHSGLSTQQCSYNIIVYREHYAVRIQYITENQWPLLQALQQPISLQKLEDDFGAVASELLPAWINKHWITTV